MPNVHRVRKGDRIHRYHRITRAKLPSDCPEDHPRFLQAWAKEEAKVERKAPPVTGSIGKAIEAWLKSDSFLSASESYRRTLRSGADSLRETWSVGRLTDLGEKHIRHDIGKLTGHAARTRHKVWRHFCGWAFDRGLISTDPSRGVRAPKEPKSDGHPPLTAEDVALVRGRWPVNHPRRLAFEIVQWTGARISDAVELGPGMVDRGGVLVYGQGKTHQPAHVPWSCSLPPFCDPADHACLMAALEHAPAGMVFIQTQHNKPRSVKAMGNWMADTIREAGIQKSAHGLRKTRLSDLAERGAQAFAIQAWGGHLSLTEAERYVRAANRRKAIMGTSDVNRPSQAVNRGVRG